MCTAPEKGNGGFRRLPFPGSADRSGAGPGPFGSTPPWGDPSMRPG